MDLVEDLGLDANHKASAHLSLTSLRYFRELCAVLGKSLDQLTREDIVEDVKRAQEGADLAIFGESQMEKRRGRS